MRNKKVGFVLLMQWGCYEAEFTVVQRLNPKNCFVSHEPMFREIPNKEQGILNEEVIATETRRQKDNYHTHHQITKFANYQITPNSQPLSFGKTPKGLIKSGSFPNKSS